MGAGSLPRPVVHGVRRRVRPSPHPISADASPSASWTASASPNSIGRALATHRRTSSITATKVALGEFLLGYSNEYCRYTDRPLLDSATPGAAGLAPAEDDSGRRDLGRNGSYLVMRQLEQDVRGFWRFVYSAAASEEDRTRLAEAMVGRRLANGDPLVPGDPPNNFTYDRDPDGVRCPFGSHIRRANPRNTDLPGRPSSLLARGWTKLGGGVTGIREDLLASTRFHRILRRGREYGPPLPPEEAARPATAASRRAAFTFSA